MEKMVCMDWEKRMTVVELGVLPRGRECRSSRTIFHRKVARAMIQGRSWFESDASG
jgi:hypothetical protein